MNTNFITLKDSESNLLVQWNKMSIINNVPLGDVYVTKNGQMRFMTLSISKWAR